jgi:hypothetical protein
MAHNLIKRFAAMQFQVADKDKSGSLNLREFLNIYAFVREQAPKKAQIVDQVYLAPSSAYRTSQLTPLARP